MKEDSKHLQLGKIGEFLAKAEFIKNGFDVYTTEVDDKGIDFIVRNKSGKYFEIQSKATNGKYVFMRKEFFTPNDSLYLVYLVFGGKDILISLIPSTEWIKNDRYKFLANREYKDSKSKPEYGIDYSKKAIEIIKTKYSFSKIISEMV